MSTIALLWVTTVLTLALSGVSYADTLQVGPGRVYQTPGAAARAARDGDIIAIDAGVYAGDVAVWPQHRLRLRGVGGRAQLQAQGNAAEEKAIWVLKGDDIVVENIEFSGAQVNHKNGAGIRFEGANLTIRNAHFHHNEMGILAAPHPSSDILIEGSEFNDNTVDYPRYGRLGHNIYIGNVRRFTLRNSYVHDASIGHDVKSRARENYILYNRIMDEHNGSSYLVDLSEGGQAYLIGNLFRQGPNTDNPVLIAFAPEGNQDNPQQSLYVVNNTAVNDCDNGVFVFNHSSAPVVLINNLLVGKITPLEGPGEQRNNLVVTDAAVRDKARFDYRLRPGSPAIDEGIDPGRAASGFILWPGFEYVHPLRLQSRPQHGAIDAGAHELGAR